MTDTSISQVLSESHSVIYGVSEEAKPQTKEVLLGMIHERIETIKYRNKQCFAREKVTYY